jgi:hypothetical protein
MTWVVDTLAAHEGWDRYVKAKRSGEVPKHGCIKLAIGSGLSRRDTMKIAQRFNAGFTAPKHFRAPSGAKEAAANPSSVPSGLGSVSTAKPSVETLGY